MDRIIAILGGITLKGGRLLLRQNVDRGGGMRWNTLVLTPSEANSRHHEGYDHNR